jgi:uncharacterized protein
MIRRNAEKTVISLSKDYPVVAITGPRQSGKSTLVKNIFNDKKYVSLEDIEIRDFAINDPKGFLGQFPDGAILDEVQRVPALFSYIQLIVDEKKVPGYFILTGSQQFGLYQDITQSLAGRVASVILLPFTFDELNNASIQPATPEQMLFAGFYPPIYDRSLDSSVWYANYTRTYIERDVRQMTQVRDLSTFQRFVRMCAARTGQLLNLSSLANDCGITHNTAKSWISILEASYIIYLLKPHFKNFNKRLVKTPKLYFYDCGLVRWLLGIQDVDQISIHPLRGELFETYVVGELLKRSMNSGLEPNIYFWRDRTGNEIDIIFDTVDALIPLEVKSGKTIVPDYFNGFKKWIDITGEPDAQGWLVYAGDESQNRKECRVVAWNRISDVRI